ncbi:MAG: c-type cytochrome [Planctomycetaceae bacterium]|nr:c-type cytochrome [Planctomycetaceae bacterium]
MPVSPVVMRTRRRLFPLLIVLSLVTPAFGQGAGDALMRLLKGGKLPPERLPAVIEMVSKRGDATELGYFFEQLTNENGWTGDVAAAALDGLVEAAENRKLKPEGDLSKIATLFDAKQPAAVRNQAIHLAGLWRAPELAEPLQVIAKAEKTAPETRSATLVALANFGEDGRKTIESLAASGDSSEVRAAAISALAGLDLAAAAKYAAQALAAAKPKEDPSALLGAFLTRQGGPDSLAAALADVTLSPESAKAALRSMYAVGRSDGSLSAALGKAAGIAMEDKPLTPEEVSKLVAAVQSEGDVERGELVFRRRDLSCLNCHAVSGAGGNIGPDLSAIGPSNPLDYLVASILDPDAAVKEHFATQIVITSDGLVVTGIVADENDARLILRTAEGTDRSIPKADIEEREKGGSLMPKGLVKFMTRQEFVDLVRFLAELGKPGTPYAVRSQPIVQRWRLLVDPPASFEDSLPDEATFRDELPPIAASDWQPLYSRVDGNLPLSDITAGEDRPRYLLAEIDVRSSGAVGLKFDDAGGLDVWVNGDHIDTLSRQLATEFPEGRQTIVVRVDPEMRTAPLKVELFRPEGSSAVAVPAGGI